MGTGAKQPGREPDPTQESNARLRRRGAKPTFPPPPHTSASSGTYLNARGVASILVINDKFDEQRIKVKEILSSEGVP